MSAGQQTFQVGARSITVGLLKVGDLKRIAPKLSVVMGIKKGQPMTAEQIEAMVAVIHASAVRHDPSLTLEQLNAAVDDLDWVDGVTLIANASAAVLTASGVGDAASRVTGGESPGEATSQSTSPSTSAGSMASSPPPPDGPIPSSTS